MATYTNLDNEIFSQAALEAFVKTMAPLNAFSNNYSSDAAEKGANVLVPLVSALAAVSFAGTYVTTNGEKTVITVALSHHKFITVGQTDVEAANSSAASLESFGYQQGRALATAVIEDILTLVTSGGTNGFSVAASVAPTAFDVAQLRAGRLALNVANAPHQPRSALIDAVPMDALLAVTNFVQAQMFADNQVLQEGRIMRALGFDFYELNSSFVSSSSAPLAFLCHASAIAVAVRYLQPQDGHTYRQANAVADPDTGLAFGIRDFYDNATGRRYIALECLYGYSTGITNGGRIIRTA